MKEPTAAKKKLDEFKASSPFWASWAVQAGFASYAKQTFKEDVLEVELAKYNEIEKLVITLDKHVSRLTKMHSAGLA